MAGSNPDGTRDDSIREKAEQQNVGDSQTSPGKMREGARSKVALFYVQGFFAVISLVFIVGFVENWSVGDHQDMLLAVSGILSGPLGFIIGYYFKGDSNC